MGFCNNTAHIRKNHFYALTRLVDGGIVDKADAFDALRNLFEFQSFGADYPDYEQEQNPILASFYASAEFSFNDLGLATAKGEKSGEIRAQKANAGKSAEPPKKSSRGGLRAGAGRPASKSIGKQSESNPMNQTQNDNLQNIDPQFVPMDSIENQKIVQKITIGKSNDIFDSFEKSNGANFEIKEESNEEIKKNQNALILQGEKSNENQTQTNKDKDKARLIDSQNQSINLAVESVSLNSAHEEKSNDEIEKSNAESNAQIQNGEIETQGEEVDDVVFDDARRLAQNWHCILDYRYVKNKFGEVWKNSRGDAMNYSQYLLFLAQQPNKHRAKNGVLCAIKHIKKSNVGYYFDEFLSDYKSVSEQEYTRLLDKIYEEESR